MRQKLLFLLSAAALACAPTLSAFEYQGLTYEPLDSEAGTCAVTGSVNMASGDLVLPEHPVDEEGREWTLTELQDNSFMFSKDLTSVTIPASVTRIGEYAFAFTQLQDIFIGPGVESIGTGAFSDTESITKFFYPSHLEFSADWGTTGHFPLNDEWKDTIFVPYDEAVTDETGCAYSPDGSRLIYVPSSMEGDFTIPSSVSTIGKGALGYCPALTSLTIPASVTSVEEDAFIGCDFTSVNFLDWNAWMNNVTLANLHSNPYLNGNAYAGGIPVKVSEWPEGMTEIGDYVLAGIKFNDDIYLPSTLRRIGAYSFYNQKEIFFVELPASLEEIGDSAFEGCELLENPLFPESLHSIGNRAYAGCLALNEVSLPENLTGLGAYAFADCTNIEKANLMCALTTLEAGLFYKCQYLSKVYFPANVEEIGDHCFYQCMSLDEISLPASLKSIGESAFMFCALNKIVLPSALTSLGKMAFAYQATFYKTSPVLNKSLTSLSIGSALETIPEGAFAGHNLIQLNLSEGLKTIAENAFNGNSTSWPHTGDGHYLNRYYHEGIIATIELPSSLETIAANAFANCNIGEIVVNEGIKELPSGALGLPTIMTLPSSLTNIASGVIDPEGCRLKTLRVKSTNPPALAESLNLPADIKDNLLLIVNQGRKSYFERNARWKQIPNIMEDGQTDITVYMTGNYPITEEIRTTTSLMPSTVTSMKVVGPLTEADLNLVAQNMISLASLDLSAATGLTQIPDRLFEGSTLHTLTLPSSITHIGENAFAGCGMLELTELPESLVSIGDQAFRGSSLISFTEFPASLESIGYAAFSSCIGMRNVTFGTNLANISQDAFKACSMLESVDLSATRLTTVESGTFSGCRMLDEIILPESVESVGDRAFERTDIRDIEFASGLSEIGAGAFSDCRRLVTANIPENVSLASESMFSSCTRLVSASFPAGTTNVGANIFSGDNKLATISSASSTAPQAERGAFSDTRTRYISLIVPYDAFRAYLNAPVWGSFSTIRLGLPVTLPAEADASAVNEDDYQDLLNEDRLEEQEEQAAIDRNTDDEEENAKARSRSIRRAAQRAATAEGRSFARIFNGAGLNTSSAIRIFINPKEDATLKSVLVDGKEMIDRMEGNSLLLPANTTGALEIICENGTVGIDGIGESAGDMLDRNAPYTVFDLNGMSMGTDIERLPAGIYIVRQGTRIHKLAVK